MVTDLRARLRQHVLPAVPVPFNEQGELAEGAQRAYVRWMAGQQVGAVVVWAHTGRGLLLDDETRGRVLSAWCEGMGDVPIVCGVGVPAATALPSDSRARTERVIDATVRMTEAAARGGAAAVLVHPPTALRHLPDVDERVLQLHSAVAGVGLPAIAFHLYSEAGGISYATRTLSRMLALEGVIGVKIATLDSVMRFQDLVSVVRAQKDALLITGEDRFLGYSLMLGADAALVGIAAALTDTIVNLLHTWFAGDLRGFVRCSETIDAFARTTFLPPMDGYVQRMLWALEADGVLPEAARDPFAPTLSDSDRDHVVQAVQAIRAV